jgi:hypothetical protein
VIDGVVWFARLRAARRGPGRGVASEGAGEVLLAELIGQAPPRRSEQTGSFRQGLKEKLPKQAGGGQARRDPRIGAPRRGRRGGRARPGARGQDQGRGWEYLEARGEDQEYPGGRARRNEALGPGPKQARAQPQRKAEQKQDRRGGGEGVRGHGRVQVQRDKARAQRRTRDAGPDAEQSRGEQNRGYGKEELVSGENTRQVHAGEALYHRAHGER